MYLKINNYFIDGNADFKGLDPMQVKAGTQIYNDDNCAYFYYRGEMVEHDDIHVISESEYLSEKERINNLPRPLTIEEQLSEKDKQIMELKEKQVVTERLINENTLAQQDLLELLIEMEVL